MWWDPVQCADPGATQAKYLHGAGVQQQATKTLCRAPRSFHLKIQKVIINLATDDRGTVKTFVRDLIV